MYEWIIGFEKDGKPQVDTEGKLLGAMMVFEKTEKGVVLGRVVRT